MKEPDTEYEEELGETDMYLARFYIDNWRERRRAEIRQYEENKLRERCRE